MSNIDHCLVRQPKVDLLTRSQPRACSVMLDAIRQGDRAAWEQLVSTYQGRLFAFIQHRLGDAALAEDLVQETFLGFLTSLPNYDERTPLEPFLFAIAAHKLTDALRQRGRRPWLRASGSEEPERPDRRRAVSSAANSQHRRRTESELLAACIRQLVQQWLSRGEFERLRCAELLFMAGWTNKATAESLGISEQAVANHKHFIVQKLKASHVP